MAFFLGPLAKKQYIRLLLSGLYTVAALFFLNELLEFDKPIYFHLVPQTFALFDLSFVGDLLSLIFALLITVLGAFIMAYSAFYIEDEQAPRFSTLINFFSLSMLGIVLSNNLLGLYVFWELTTICSYFLISFDSNSVGSGFKARSLRHSATSAAWQSLLITAFGGICLLCGFLILGGIGQSYDLLEMRLPLSHPWFNTALVFIFLGVFTKSAQFPFHFWLPNASVAPAPATAYLHSATMVQAGVFLLFKLAPYLAGQPLWNSILVPIGMGTAIFAAISVLFEKDLKRILAFTTISSLGLLVYMLGRNTAATYYVAVLWVLAHAFYKAPLFLLAGNIERYAGSRDVTTLSKLYPKMKGSLLVAVLALASLLACPPVLSYHVKNLFFGYLGNSPWEFIALIIIFGSAASVGLTIIYLFIKNDSEPEQKISGTFFDDDDDPALLWLPPAAALLLSFLLGLRFTSISQFILNNLGQTIPLNFDALTGHPASAVPGYYVSFTIIFVSIFFAAVAPSLRTSRFLQSGITRLWNFLLYRLQTTAKFIFDKIQNNRIEFYCITCFAFLFFLVTSIPGLELAFPLLSLQFPTITLFELALIASMIFACSILLKVESNLSALAVLGIIGFGMAFLYLVNAAPDLALAQFMVESLTLFILVLTFKNLPKTPVLNQNSSLKAIQIIVSAGIGIICGILTFLASASLRPQTLTNYFGEESWLLGKGKNVVNVIVVNFRGFDTLGEIIVLAMAAVGFAGMIKLKADGAPKP